MDRINQIYRLILLPPTGNRVVNDANIFEKNDLLAFFLFSVMFLATRNRQAFGESILTPFSCCDDSAST